MGIIYPAGFPALRSLFPASVPEVPAPPQDSVTLGAGPSGGGGGATGGAGLGRPSGKDDSASCDPSLQSEKAPHPVFKL